jgi:uncharacterized protein YbgA (DUF1722 family)/uncharacterized protein YbbK (DUF523 family)
MMEDNIRPQVVVSKCIEFASCRYNGLQIASPIVQKMQDFVDFIPVCPEVEIGLGVPRDSLRLVMVDDEIRLMQPANAADYTEKMQTFSCEFLQSLPRVDGFILKGRSPSCGIDDVKLYKSIGKAPALSSKASGIFGQAVREMYSDLACEDEGRLTNLYIREHFFTKLFTLTRFHQLKKNMGELVDFHTKNKYLFMAYDQAKLKLAGNIVANHNKLSTERVFDRYKNILYQIFAKSASIAANINVLMHIMGYFSKELIPAEKIYFLRQLELYRMRQIPLSALTSVLQAWIIHYKQDYLVEQSYFNPFPQELMHISDSGKGRMVK